MMDCGISEVVPKKKVDLIFYSESHNRANMTFENFLNALTKVSQALGYNKRGSVEGFHCLIHEYMMPLYVEIQKSPNFYTVTILENDVKFDELCNYLIRNVGQVLYQTYSAYFPWEIANSTIYSGLGDRSEKAYKEFLKDFDICPSILTKTMSFQLWNSVIELPNETYKEVADIICSKKAKGKHLTFSKFIDLLVKISYLYARETQEMPGTYELPAEIFVMLLEKLELSTGFLNLEKKTNKPHTSRTSLLPSKEVLNLIRNAKDGDVEEVIYYIREKNARMLHKMEQKRQMSAREPVPHNFPQTMIVNPMDKSQNPGRSSTQQSYFEPQSQYDPEPVLEQPENVEESEGEIDENDQFNQDLVNVFEMYCSLSDPLNTQFLSLNKFMRMMQDAIQMCGDTQRFYLSNPDIELIFAKAINYEGEGIEEDKPEEVLNFPQFVFALELVAMKVYNNQPNSINYLI